MTGQCRPCEQTGGMMSDDMQIGAVSLMTSALFLLCCLARIWMNERRND
jgi:hypothetical protein